MGSCADFKDCDLKLARFFEDPNEFELVDTCETELAETLYVLIKFSLILNWIDTTCIDHFT